MAELSKDQMTEDKMVKDEMEQIKWHDIDTHPMSKTFGIQKQICSKLPLPHWLTAVPGEN